MSIGMSKGADDKIRQLWLLQILTDAAHFTRHRPGVESVAKEANTHEVSEEEEKHRYKFGCQL